MKQLASAEAVASAEHRISACDDRPNLVQLPAMNTPQFNWTRSRMPQRAQPVAPIFQPEVGAEAIVWAAEQRRREVWVGWPTVEAVVVDKLAPGLLDR